MTISRTNQHGNVQKTDWEGKARDRVAKNVRWLRRVAVAYELADDLEEEGLPKRVRIDQATVSKDPAKTARAFAQVLLEGSSRAVENEFDHIRKFHDALTSQIDL